MRTQFNENPEALFPAIPDCASAFRRHSACSRTPGTPRGPGRAGVTALAGLQGVNDGMSAYPGTDREAGPPADDSGTVSLEASAAPELSCPFPDVTEALTGASAPETFLRGPNHMTAARRRIRSAAQRRCVQECAGTGIRFIRNLWVTAAFVIALSCSVASAGEAPPEETPFGIPSGALDGIRGGAGIAGAFSMAADAGVTESLPPPPDLSADSILAGADSSDENRLSSLQVSEGTLTPSFSPDRQDYSVTVAHNVTKLTIGWALADQKASCSVTGNSLAENATTNVTVTVTAESGATRAYLIRATRQAAPKSSENHLSSLQVSGFSLSPSFSPDRQEYSVSVPHETVRLTLSYQTSSAAASVAVTGNDLAAGTVSSVTLTVTAEDGSARSYVIKATRAAAPVEKSSDNRLLSLSVVGYKMSPAFSPDLLEYSVTVPAATERLSFIYYPYNPAATASVYPDILNGTGTTNVQVIVTAENGAKRTYVVHVAKTSSASQDNRLVSLSVEGASLSPAFSSDRLEYSVSVPSATSKLVLSYQTSDAKATVTVTGNTLAPGAVTAVSVRVTAESGAVRTYVISASRAAAAKSAENRLSQLSVAGYPLSPPFSPDRSAYTVSVENKTSKLDLSIRTADPKASVSVSGNTLAENAVTDVTVKVTAEDGSARSYTVSAFRASSVKQPHDTDSRLASLIPSAGVLSPAFSKTVTDYTVLLPAGIESVTFSASPSGTGASVSSTQPARLQAGSDNLFTFTVTAGDGSKSVYKVTVKLTGTAGAHAGFRPGPVRPGGAVWANSPEIIALESTGDTMILPAGLLNSLFRSPGSSFTVSNPVGQVSVKGEQITGVTLPYYNMTLARSTRRTLPGTVPADAVVVSTEHEGELFGKAEFRVFTDSEAPCYAYIWDPSSQTFTPLSAERIAPQDGAVRFLSSSSGTFILTAVPIPGAGAPAEPVPDTAPGFLGSRMSLVLSALAVLTLFCLSYLTGTITADRKARPGQARIAKRV